MKPSAAARHVGEAVEVAAEKGVEHLSPRVGGDIKQPMKVRDVKPVYPPEAQAARVQFTHCRAAAHRRSVHFLHRWSLWRDRRAPCRNDDAGGEQQAVRAGQRRHGTAASGMGLGHGMNRLREGLNLR